MVIKQLQAQNDRLVKQNTEIAEQNKYILNKVRVHCSSISGIGDAVLALMEKLDQEKMKTEHIGDSLVMLWGQLTVCGVLDEKRQVHMNPYNNNVNNDNNVSLINLPPYLKEFKDNFGVNDLFCEESQASSSSGLD